MKKGQIRATIAAFLLALLVLGTGTDAQALSTSSPFNPERWAEVGQPETGLTLFEGNYRYPVIDGAGNIAMWSNTTAYGLKDSAGNVVLPCEYEAFRYEGGVILAVHGDFSTTSHVCAYDKTGRKLFEEDGVIEISLYGDSELFRVVYYTKGTPGHNDDKIYMYDRNFTPVTKDYEISLALGDGYYTATKDGKFGIYKQDVGLVIPCQYEDIGYVGGDLFSAAKDKQLYQGVIDLNNNQVLPFQFDYIKSYLNGYFLVGKFKDRVKTVDTINSVGWQTWMTDFGEETLFGVADLSGSLVVPQEHDALSLTEEDGRTVARVSKWTGEYRSHWANGGPGIGKIYEVAYSIDLSTASTPAQPVQQPAAAGFADVPANAYYANAVTWAIDKGITNGTGANTFSPENTCNNAEILTFIWRAKGQPEPTISNPFGNVKTGDYYYKAVLWAYQNGLVSGSTFNASAPCTRSMVVTCLWKAAGSPAAGGSVFSDVPASASYAQAVAWAVSKGITNGEGGNTFAPDKTCTRGQIVTFLNRAYAD